MILDTSGIFSAFSPDQVAHEGSKRAMYEADIRYVPALVIAEIDFVATSRFGRSRAIRFLRALSGPEYEILSFGDSTLSKAIELMATYSDMNIGVVDAALVVHAAEHNTNEILTLDQRRFRAMRGLDGRHFKLLPFDM